MDREDRPAGISLIRSFYSLGPGTNRHARRLLLRELKEGPMIENPVRGRFNAWFLDVLEDYMHRKFADIKSGLLAEGPPVVVELGPGPGANLRYLPKGTKLIAVEPNTHMHARLRRNAARYGIDLEIRGLVGEELDLASDSVDLVLSSLVLCTVDRPERVLEEVRRILKPSGRFVCLEHVRAPSGSGVERTQRLLRKPWSWVFEGCDLCRDIGGTLRSAGFAEVEITPHVIRTVFVPLRHQIAAVCVN